MHALRPGERTSERLDRLAPYSYRADPAVPDFPDDKAIIVFDGVCVLCSTFAKFVAARDGARRYRFIAAQSIVGTALYRHLGLDPVNYETNLLIANGKVSAKMGAVVGIMSGLGGIWRAAAVVGWLPARISDRIYDCVARNRYSLFGRRGHCIRADQSWRDRVIE